MTPHHLMARKFGTYLQEIKSDFFLAYESGPYHGRPYLRFHAKGRWVHGAFDSSILFRGPRFLKFPTKNKSKIKEQSNHIGKELCKMRAQFTLNRCIKCHHFIKFSSIKSMVQRKFIISCVNKKL